MQINRLVLEGLENGRIRELYLYKLGELKNVTDWTKVKEIGQVYFKGKYALYSGGLVKHGEKVYFLSDAVIKSLSQYRKWNFKKKIEVITELDWKKKVTEFQSKYTKSNEGQVGHIKE